MFDDLKQDDNQSAPAPATPTLEANAQVAQPAPVSQPNKIDDMFGDVDPVAVDHGPVDPDKPSAIQSGKIKAVSQTTAVSPESSVQATQVPPQPVAQTTTQQTVQTPNIPPSNSMMVTDDRSSTPMNKIIIAVLVFLLLTIASVTVYYFFLKDRGVESVIEDNTNTEATLNENSNEEVIDDEVLINEDDLDDDSDGLSNGLEKIYGTNPLEPDTDNDGLGDQDEIELYLTDPLIADTDNDGLNDYEEIIIYKTKADDPDTDGDGYQDGAEVNNGYNPLGSGKLNENL